MIELYNKLANESGIDACSFSPGSVEFSLHAVYDSVHLVYGFDNVAVAMRIGEEMG